MSKNVVRVGTNIITLSDVLKLNAQSKQEEIIVEIENTKGQNKDLFKRFNSNITISILGGLNYVKKDKYNDNIYRERTFYKPRQVYSIIKRFEEIEANLDQSWSQLEKVMYIYKVLVENLSYNYNIQSYKNKEINRNLLVIETRVGVCSGFSMVFKELMDRLGITCDYQNKDNHHSFNVIQIDDKYIPLDITQDICEKENEKDGKCHFKYFGTKQDFYNDEVHSLYGDNDEKMYEITVIPEDILSQSYQNILKNKTHLASINEVMINNQKVEYSMDHFEDKVICLYRINNKLHVNYYAENSRLEDILLDNEISSNDSDLNLPIFRIYSRDDNSMFAVIKYPDKDNTYLYCEFDNDNYRSFQIISETDLINIKIDTIVSNKLLSKERLLRKVDKFNGYVGYIRNNKLTING